MNAEAQAVICPECNTRVAVVASREAVWAALRHHRCNRTTERKHIMSAQPLRPVPDVPKRPHPRDLVAHDDPKIARAAKKVVDAITVLDQVWADNAAKAELRAQRDRLKAQLAEVEAQIKGGPVTAPKRDTKAIRAWAGANGYEVAPAGIIPKHIVEAYEAAQR
jgi:hypothetical protein